MAIRVSTTLVFFFLVAVACATNTLNDEICDDDFYLVDSNPFDNLQASCVTAKQQLDVHWCAQEPGCLGSSSAMAAATVPTLITNGVTTTLLQFPGLGFAYTAANFTLATTAGGPGISRGVIFIPETGVAPEAYAPMARNMSGRGYYTFVLTETSGKPAADVISDVYQAVATRTELTAWALVGHGNGGTIASKVIFDDKNKRFNALTMLGAVTYPGVDLRAINVQLIYVYGALDTVVSPAQALNVISNFIPRDSLVIRMPNAAHMDFTFTSCVGNSFTMGRGGCGNLRLSNHLASLTLPAANSGNKVLVNAENPIVQTNGGDGVLLSEARSCRPQLTEYFDEASNSWASVTPAGDDIVDLLYVIGGGDSGNSLRVEARTNRNAYGALTTFLQGKRVRASVSCRNLDVQCIEFSIGSAAELQSNALTTLTIANAAPQPNLYSAVAQMLTAMVGRAATERALSFFDNSVLYPVGALNNSKPYPANYYAPVEAQIIDVPPTDPVNVPLATQWYVFRPRTPAVPLGGYVYYPGGAVQAQAYAALAFEIAARGYVVVIPTVPLRIATSNVAVFQAIYNSPLFADVPVGKWATGGHSLGGIAACQAVFAFPTQIKALVMHAGGLVGSFLSRPQRVAQIYGSLDGLSPGGSERFRTPLLPLINPSLTQIVAIQGGVHYGFADYGYHFPDNVATISLQDQQTQAAQLTVANLALAFQ